MDIGNWAMSRWKDDPREVRGSAGQCGVVWSRVRE